MKRAVMTEFFIKRPTLFWSLMVVLIIAGVLSFVQMLFPISATAKGVLWAALFGTAKGVQYLGLFILGAEGVRRVKGYFRRNKKRGG